MDATQRDAALEKTLAYHEETKHRLDRYARNPGYLLGAAAVSALTAQSLRTNPRIYELNRKWLFGGKSVPGFEAPGFDAFFRAGFVFVGCSMGAVSMAVVASVFISSLLVGTFGGVIVVRLPLCSLCGLVSRTAVCGDCVNTRGYAAWRKYEFALRRGDRGGADAVISELQASMRSTS